ncbi:hypothetical protein AB0C34_13515 [Nocardia sp. NPDC049220]|uniref:hypothetical protein n=1 Tax=Nocardia sp. NPDC049220 TaxID=3155273 RepID=UPI0033D1706B
MAVRNEDLPNDSAQADRVFVCVAVSSVRVVPVFVLMATDKTVFVRMHRHYA